jgi:hypothetical protein
MKAFTRIATLGALAVVLGVGIHIGQGGRSPSS